MQKNKFTKFGKFIKQREAYWKNMSFCVFMMGKMELALAKVLSDLGKALDKADVKKVNGQIENLDTVKTLYSSIIELECRGGAKAKAFFKKNIAELLKTYKSLARDCIAQAVDILEKQMEESEDGK